MGVVSKATLLSGLVAVRALAQDCAYVATLDGGVSVINLAHNLPSASIGVEGEPLNLAASPDDSFVFVTDSFEDVVVVINTATNSVATRIRVDDSPVGIAVSPSEPVAYATNYESISIIDIRSFLETHRIETFEDSRPSGVTFTLDGKKAYVANRFSSTGSVIDTATRQIVGQIAVGQGPRSIAIRPQGDRAFVTNVEAGTVSVINTGNDSVSSTIPTEPSPLGIAFSPDGNRAYVTHLKDGKISVLHVGRSEVERVLVVEGADQLFSLAIRSNGTLYVSDTDNDQVLAIDPATLEVRAAIPTHIGPLGIVLISPPNGCPPLPTPTPTVTRTPTPTLTATQTPVPTQAPCVGDCDGNGAITVDELLRGISIALGSAALAQCPQFDPSRDEAVTVEEITAGITAALLGCVPLPQPNTLYVRALNGDDTRDGRSPSAALRTIQAAVDRAAPGDEIIVGPGAYREQVVFRSPGGHPLNPITLTANPVGNLTGDPPGNVVIDSNRLGSAIFIDEAQHITVDGFQLTNSSAPAIHVRRESVGTEIRNCQIFNNAEDGIRVLDSDDVVIFNNLVYCNLRRGILIGGSLTGSNRARVIHNTVAQNGDRGLFIGNTDAASTDAFLRNNIIQNNGTAELQVVTVDRNSLEGFDADYNMVFDDLGQSGQYVGAAPGPNDLVVQAAFVEEATCEPFQSSDVDYRLAQTSAGQLFQSSGIDAGDPALASRFASPLRVRTTSTDNALDILQLDLGYHFLPEDND